MKHTEEQIQKMRAYAEKLLINAGAVPIVKNKAILYEYEGIKLTPWEEQKDNGVLFRWDDTTRSTGGKKSKVYPFCLGFLIGMEGDEMTILAVTKTL
ncbi:MAG: hypothetical protein JRL30_28220 [Deltaproteobacteria bacterium]|nr:hypothetical protein [Deltaproteobacteria bacterium]